MSPITVALSHRKSAFAGTSFDSYRDSGRCKKTPTNAIVNPASGCYCNGTVLILTLSCRPVVTLPDSCTTLMSIRCYPDWQMYDPDIDPMLPWLKVVRPWCRPDVTMTDSCTTLMSTRCYPDWQMYDPDVDLMLPWELYDPDDDPMLSWLTVVRPRCRPDVTLTDSCTTLMSTWCYPDWQLYDPDVDPVTLTDSCTTLMSIRCYRDWQLYDPDVDPMLPWLTGVRPWCRPNVTLIDRCTTLISTRCYPDWQLYDPDVDLILPWQLYDPDVHPVLPWLTDVRPRCRPDVTVTDRCTTLMSTRCYRDWQLYDPDVDPMLPRLTVVRPWCLPDITLTDIFMTLISTLCYRDWQFYDSDVDLARIKIEVDLQGLVIYNCIQIRPAVLALKPLDTQRQTDGQIGLRFTRCNERTADVPVVASRQYCSEPNSVMQVHNCVWPATDCSTL